jgi:hypothetical protein
MLDSNKEVLAHSPGLVQAGLPAADEIELAALLKARETVCTDFPFDMFNPHLRAWRFKSRNGLLTSGSARGETPHS